MVESVLALNCVPVPIPVEGSRGWPGSCQRLEKLGTAGNLVTDAQIAAFAIEHHAVLHTNDTDFMRFTGLRWFKPLTGAASVKLRRH